MTSVYPSSACELPLPCGCIALIDAADYDRVSRYRWRRRKGSSSYIVACGKGNCSKYLHRYILDAPDGVRVDHKNRNRLDNRRENLRLCTAAENAHNTGIRSDNRSGFKGVSRTSRGGPNKVWCAFIGCEGKRRLLGYYADPIDAALAYNTAALKLFGEFAYLNDIP